MNHRLTSILTLSVVLAAAGTAATDEPAAKKPLGTWERQIEGGKVQFHFTADQLVATVEKDGGKVVVYSDYGVTKDGVVFGICTKAVKDGIDGPSPGELFSFHIVAHKEKLTLSELKLGDDKAKSLIEGEYKLAPEKK